jgi:hypothetical protein
VADPREESIESRRLGTDASEEDQRAICDLRIEPQSGDLQGVSAWPYILIPPSIEKAFHSCSEDWCARSPLNGRRSATFPSSPRPDSG